MIIRFNKVKALDITSFCLHTDLHDLNYASRNKPRNEDENGSHSSIPSLLSCDIESDSESDDESNLESAIDLTQMYRYGELEDEWSGTMEVEMMDEGTMEDFDIHSLLAYQGGTDFSLANP